MKLAELRQRPTTIGTSANGQRVHESVLRSYGMLQKVRELLIQEDPVPPHVLLEMIDDVLDAPNVTKEI